MGISLFGFVSTYLKLVRFCIEPILRVLAKKGSIAATQNETLKLSIAELCTKIQNQEIKCEDLIREFIERIKEVEPEINAVVEDRFEQALKEAQELDIRISEEKGLKLPLLGVPFTVKQVIAVEGLSKRNGSYNQPKDCTYSEDSLIVQILKEAGAIPLLISNTPEASFGWETNNHVKGLTRNPYHLGRSAGGSSGGECALIATNCGVFGLGTDTGGSIRLPCHFNGTCGHKPTPGFVPTDSSYPQFDANEFKKYNVLGPIANSVADLQLLMEVMTQNHKELALNSVVHVEKIKILYAKSLSSRRFMQKVDREIQDAIGRITSHLAQKCEVRSFNARQFYRLPEVTIARIITSCQFPPFLQTKPGYLSNDFTKKGSYANPYLELIKSAFRCSKFSLSLIFFEIARRTNGSLFCRAKKWLKVADKMEQQIHELLSENTVLILPTFPRVSIAHGTMVLSSTDATYLMIANAFGLPATHVPVGFNEEGLPYGVQVIGGPKMDRLTLAVAGEIENFVKESAMKKKF